MVRQIKIFSGEFGRHHRIERQDIDIRSGPERHRFEITRRDRLPCRILRTDQGSHLHRNQAGIKNGHRADDHRPFYHDPAENDDGTRTASADVSDLITLYTNSPVGGNGWYGLLGYHMATVETNETLNE